MPDRLAGSRTDAVLLAGAVLTGVGLVAAAASSFSSMGSVEPARPEAARSKVPVLPYQVWYGVPVQQGRMKPFQSACVEAVRQITGRAEFEGHDPVALVLTWMLTSGQPLTDPWTRWEIYPFILCEHRGLRQKIFEHTGKPAPEGKYVTPEDLRDSPGFDELAGRVAAARVAHGARAHLHLGEEELRAEEVSHRLVLYDALRGRAATRLKSNALAGQQFLDLAGVAAAQGTTAEEVLARHEELKRHHPDPLHLAGLDRAASSAWFSISELVLLQKGGPSRWEEVLRERKAESPHTYPGDDQPFPARSIEQILGALESVRLAYDLADAARFEAASQEFFAALREATEAAGNPYPGSHPIDLELLFNRTQPFRWAWVLMFAAALAFLFSLNLPSRLVYLAAFFLTVASLAVQVFGFTCRVLISGWAPVGNMYETVIFAAFMAACFAVVLELIYRRRVFGLAGAGVATLGLLLADQMPLALDPKISPLVPVLRTNYWLTVHVLTIVCGYGAGTLAWGLGNLSLALLAFGRGNAERVRMLGELTYRSLQLTVVLLATGTFLGGWWAAHAWGRFWGWDPKEVGALVALVCYVVPLHARYVGWVKDYGLAVGAVLCYGAIILSWYVLNFVLTAGFHSYGFGLGGGPWVLLAVLLNVEWLFIASLLYRRRARNIPPTPTAPTTAPLVAEVSG
jgi:ABC-type transport system involved in cytochrome c biogenesis permease subunit